jgi:hypothetical protein
MEDLYNKQWHVLNINVKNALRSTFNPPEFFAKSEFKDGQVGLWAIHDKDLHEVLFSDEWLEYMESLDLKVGSCLVFYRAPHYIHNEIHVDVYKTDHEPAIYALNWTLEEEDDSEMVWYDIPIETGALDTELIPTPYKHWPMDGGYPEIARRSIGNKMTMVNIGLPHNVIVRDKPRWCFSVRMYRKSKPITDWKSAVDYFKPFIEK